MARKIFVSYKHNDSSVRPLTNSWEPTTARHYVDQLQEYLDNEDHIYKGEGNEDLGEFKDDTIESKLKEKIFDSSITIVLISKNMKDSLKPDNDQWIPWEISYSLRKVTKGDRTSVTNALLAVVIPDENNSYEYLIKPTGCPCNSINWANLSLFEILGKNMFNRKVPKGRVCPNGICSPIIHEGNDHSYAYPVKWDEFIRDVNLYINYALEIKQNINDYEVVKVVST